MVNNRGPGKPLIGVLMSLSGKYVNALLLTSCLFRANCFKATNSVKAIFIFLIFTISTLIWQGRDPVRTFSFIFFSFSRL